ncbi:MAG: phage tail protein [Limisphaerales bacterium]
MPESDATPVGNFRYELLFTENRLKSGGNANVTQPVAGGAFAECSGLEATMEPKVIREGGLNYGTHQRVGPVSFATVILRRGMTLNHDLWEWFRQVTLLGSYTHRMDLAIRHLDFDGRTVVRTWHLDRALPVKFKSSDLNARSGELAIEELHLVHEGFKRV